RLQGSGAEVATKVVPTSLDLDPGGLPKATGVSSFWDHVRMSVAIEEQLSERTVDMAVARLPATEGGARDAPGFYACWLTDQSALPMVPLGAGGLLYVDIAPKDASSSASIRSRMLGNHLGNAIGSSTLRRGLTAVLWEPTRWPHFMKGKKVALSPEHCTALTVWMERDLHMSRCPIDRPRTYEPTLIGDMQPPLNSDHNHGHPFYPTLKAARRHLMAVAREQTKKACISRAFRSGRYWARTSDLRLVEAKQSGYARVAPGKKRQRTQQTRGFFASR